MRVRRWWGTGAVVAAGVCGTLVAQGVFGGFGGGGGGDGRPGAVTHEVRSAALKVSGGGGSASLERRDTDVFSMLGVTWEKPSAKVAGTVEVRTRAVGSGQWSDWLSLDGDTGAGENSAARGGTEPAWVGPSDGVEVRVGGKSGARLPEGLRVDMIGGSDENSGPGGGLEPAAFVADGDSSDEPSAPETESESESPSTSAAPDLTDGTTVEPSPSESESESVTGEPSGSTSPTSSSSSSESPAPSESTSATVSPSPSPSTPTAPPSTVPQPPITPRSGWNADEGLSPEEPSYTPDGRIKAVVLHHTAQSNAYTCDEAPSIINSIYTYDVKTLGWKDLGYNFVVDKCGTVYEGRKGGVDLPVVGAHAYGFNSQTTGIAVLGTYTDSVPSQAAMTSVARLAAWKLGQYGIAPDSTVTLTTALDGQNLAGKSWGPGEEMRLPAIHGHRDGYNTLCPGDAYYAALGTVRELAAGPVTGLTLTSVTGTTPIGSTPYTSGPVTVNWSATTPSALISEFQVLVDGKTAATAKGSATSAKVTLGSGKHQVQVRAVHQSGRTATSTAVTVVADTTAPTFTTKPNLALRTGTVTATAVPLTLNWKAADTTALKDVRLTAPAAKTYGPTVTTAQHTAKPGAATVWSMKAYDMVGNTATASVTGTPVILQETSAKRTGTWTSKSSTSYLGGKSLTSKTKNASLTWTFTGRSVAWVVSRASTSGQAYVYVDGKKVTTVDLKSSTTSYRNAIWTKTWSSAAKHTVRIVVVGTSKRPTITTDGLVYLK
ncbi:peptidoglycan recognition protein family protein [Streptomyces antibioticus]|uniref:N-acetylmuramoyl-L-alanine amidase n=1 Tax=Streptomyces antibioticus TaxID=1890 RepID=A0AAE7CLS6_STRAT|nr:peptidoglycan recognition protein [Streptomyces antibioticus]OOQ50910.1 N-acetylmuramoyl-L-alanine amidase [Streptomyces antibioticus]QIT45053.1 N-acetylmuramoyl-L-alanine amidase [Streptomyces antibioticus]